MAGTSGPPKRESDDGVSSTCAHPSAIVGKPVSSAAVGTGVERERKKPYNFRSGSAPAADRQTLLLPCGRGIKTSAIQHRATHKPSNAKASHTHTHTLPKRDRVRLSRLGRNGPKWQLTLGHTDPTSDLTYACEMQLRTSARPDRLDMP